MAYENGTWLAEGTRIDFSTLGLAQGTVIADGTATELSDGRIRVYIVGGDNIHSLVSSDGKTFSTEGLIGLREGSGMPKAETIDGGVRLYVQQGDAIISATSTDGITFSEESGSRLTYSTATAGGSKISSPSLVTVGSTVYAYYGDVDATAGSGRNDHAVFAATTVDGLSFTVDGTALIGTGSSLGNTAEHPDAIGNPDGSVTVFYSDNTVAGNQGGATSIWHATSTDGTTFTTEVATGISGNDPFLLRSSDGTLRLYAGDFDSTTGGYVRSAIWIEDVAAGTTAADTIAGTDYSNQISGAAGDDLLSGAGGADLVYGNTGIDVLYGNRGADSLFGGQDADILYGGREGDAVYGNLGADVIYGNLGDDSLFGGQGDDILFGGQGADTLNGNRGDDQLFGNAGADVFRFGADSGSDSIGGFTIGEDTIAILTNVNGSGLADFAALQSVMTTVNGTDTQIDLGGGNAVVLTGVLPSTLGESDFSFF